MIRKGARVQLIVDLMAVNGDVVVAPKGTMAVVDFVRGGIAKLKLDDGRITYAGIEKLEDSTTALNRWGAGK